MAEPLSVDPNMALQRAVVVGGGVAGLVAARELAAAGVIVTVLESADRIGGQVSRAQIDGIGVDVGAESYATRGGHVDALIKDLGLEGRIVSPRGGGAWLRKPVPAGPSASVPLPKGGLLGIPANPFAADVRAVIGWGGAWRAYLDRVRPVLTIGKEYNLGKLVSSRMGRSVRDLLVAPVTGGVYSAAPEDIDVERAAPGLNNALTRAGSLSGAVALLKEDAAKKREAGAPGQAVRGIDGGMYGLVEALADAITAKGGSIRTGAAATSLARTDALGAEERAELDERGEALPADGWVVSVEGGESVVADVVLLAGSESAAAALLTSAGYPGTITTGGEQPGVEVVTLVLDAPALDAAPRGSGLLVAEGAPVGAKALTHATAKWEWLGTQAGKRHVVRLSYGRQGSVSAIDGLADDAVIEKVIADASDLLGTPIARDAVRGWRRTPWTGTMPVSAVGQAERSDEVRAAVEKIRGIDVAGGWLAGTGLAAVVPDAIEAAARLRHEVYLRYLGTDAS